MVCFLATVPAFTWRNKAQCIRKSCRESIRYLPNTGSELNGCNSLRGWRTEKTVSRYGMKVQHAGTCTGERLTTGDVNVAWKNCVQLIFFDGLGLVTNCQRIFSN